MGENINEAPVFIEVPETINTEESEFPTITTKRFKCPECKRYSAENEDQLLRHIRKIHRGEDPFQCGMCEYTTANKVQFEEHVRIHQGIKPFQCSLCDYKTASKKNLKKHELIHAPDYHLKCPNCPHIAKHKRALTCHMRVCCEANLYKCTKCDKRFEDRTGLKGHVKSAKKCDLCSHQACSKTLLNLHRVMKHGEPGKKFTKKTKNDLFKCALCEWSSSSKPRILLHLIHHPNQTVDESVIDITILRNHRIMA